MTKRAPKIRPLPEWIPTVSPRFKRPDHLAPITDLFAAIARGESVRACLSAPPRHAKTTTIEHGAAWLIAQNPGLRLIWATYAARFSGRSSRRIRETTVRVGVPLAPDAKARENWRTGIGDGGMWCTSVGGSITGEGADLLIVDDPTKGRAEAESALARDALYEWFNDDALTRLEPGASVIVSGARWHEDDLIGRLVELDGWDYRCLPAIGEDGRALWPARYPIEKLREIEEQLGAYGWSSLFMGAPQPRGGQLFGDVHFYDELPLELRIGKGVDFAYTAKTSRDQSAAIVIGEKDKTYYVLDVVRAQTTVDTFISQHLRIQSAKWAGRYTFYSSTTEQGISQFSQLLGPDDPKIDARLARVDKFTRAQPVAAAWNAGKIFLPRSAPWLDAFVAELKSFTGVRDRRDDQVDALAAAFDSIAHRQGGTSRRAIKRAPPSPFAGWCEPGGSDGNDRGAGLSHDVRTALRGHRFTGNSGF